MNHAAFVLSCFALGVFSTVTVTIYDVSASPTEELYEIPTAQEVVRLQDLLKLTKAHKAGYSGDMHALARVGRKEDWPKELYIMDEDATANPKTKDLIFIVAKPTGKKLRWHECGS
eukprot:GHVU01220455.1.p1 GENE.GHVU01220455.1~~GHVU01220455.1.p1  ORF type:complete len:116 (+),score=12.09 GHVU01220455.1:493-840(+)